MTEQTTTPRPAHESFTRNADGSKTCNDCGQTYRAPYNDGPVLRSHRRNAHGEYHYTPARCWA